MPRLPWNEGRLIQWQRQANSMEYRVLQSSCRPANLSGEARTATADNSGTVDKRPLSESSYPLTRILQHLQITFRIDLQIKRMRFHKTISGFKSTWIRVNASLIGRHAPRKRSPTALFPAKGTNFYIKLDCGELLHLLKPVPLDLDLQKIAIFSRNSQTGNCLVHPKNPFSLL
jgi:hypothetical protein